MTKLGPSLWIGGLGPLHELATVLVPAAFVPVSVQCNISANTNPELQKGGILVSRIPDISGRKSGHFQIVAANHSIFGRKGYNTVDLWHSSTKNEEHWEEN